jgi:RHS repeat-associated protein
VVTLIEVGGTNCKAPTPPNAPGNPIFAGTGNKYQREVDYAGPGLLSLVRHYNSGLKTWVHNYMMRVQANSTTAIAIRPDGKTLVFNGGGAGAWSSNATVVEKLTRLNPGDATNAAWRLDTGADTIELYDANGLPMSVTVRGGRSVWMAYSGGTLQSVTDDFGRSLSFGYDTQGRLANVSAPGGEIMRYGYGANGHLSVVTYADNTTRQYLYEKAGMPYALTGLIDQNGQRFATWGYDSQGRAVSSEHAGGVERYTLSFDPNGLNVLVTDPLGAQRMLQHQNVAGRLVFAGGSQPCANCTGDAASTAVNAIGKVTQATDFAGVASQYSYDETRQLPLGSTRAAGRPEAQSRTIAWHATFRLPTLITEAGRSTAYTYDNRGNKLSETITDADTGKARTHQWSYNAQNLVATMTDPRGGMWTYGYDSAGNRTSARNPLGQQTGYAYDAAGRVTNQTDPNGLVTTYTYDARGRLLAQTRGSETTTFGYTPAGQLASSTQPDGYQIAYTYDAAQRLIGVADNRGATVQYTRDAMGNRVREEVKDANGNIALATGRVIDSLNRVAATQGAQGQTTALAYDANGEQISVTDPLQQTTRQTLDGLRRNVATTFADNSSSGQTWNQLDQLTEVTDPKGVKTGYQSNALGDLVSETGPDIGTISYQRDANGDVIAVTDAKGSTRTITRDALGRPTQITDADQTQSFSYDVAGNVMRIDDKSGSTFYTRDLQGRIIDKTQAVNDNPTSPTRYGIQYAYSGGALASITYPSGLQVLLRRTAGRITGVDVQPAPKAGKAQPVTPFVSGLAYTALGAPKSWIWSTGDSASRNFDADGRMTQSEIASYTYDAASRITAITQNLWAQGPKVQGTEQLYQVPTTWSASYDNRNRLTGLARSGAASNFQYDTNSNRLAATETTASSLDLEAQFDADNITQSASQATRIDAASNKLLGFSQTTTTTSGTASNSLTSQVNYALDANGALTSDGLRTFVYDASGRLSKAEVFNNGEGASIAYWHNALGQRVFKSEPQVGQLPPKQQKLDQGFIRWLEATFGWIFPSGNGAKATLGMAYVYDEQGNLLGEYDNGSAQGRGATEYIWLPTEQGQAIPIGIYKNGSFYAVHADHLGTPRLVTDSAKAPVWQWPYSAFGNNKPTGPLSAIATGTQTRLKATPPALEVNLRFPGQYFDSESNLSYNYFRSYQASQGRYTQPDPIGLGGGANRFSYVAGNPLSFADPKGLQAAGSDRSREDRDREQRPPPRTDPPAPGGASYFRRYEQCMADCESRDQWKCWAVGTGAACVGALGGPWGAMAAGLATGPTCFIAVRAQCQTECNRFTAK